MSKSQELAQLASYINVNTSTSNVFFGPTISPTISFDTNSGIVTSSSLDATNLNITNINSSGIATLGSEVSVAGDISATGDISVTGDSTVSGNSSVSGILTVSQSLDVNGTVDVSGLATLNDTNISGVSTFVGIATFGGGLSLSKFATEKFEDHGTNMATTQNIDLENGMIHWFYGGSTGSGSRTPNFRYNSTTPIGSIVKVGQCFSVIIMMNSTTYFCGTTLQIDGTSIGSAIFQANGYVPDQGSATGTLARDVYTYFVMRIAETGAASDWVALYNYIKYE